MCGISAIIQSPDLMRPVSDDVARLIDQNLHRGNRHFGFMGWCGERTSLRRFTRPYDKTYLPDRPLHALIVHVRAPTGGGDGIEDVHPFSSGSGYLFMNGILIDYDNDRMANRKHHVSKVDTAYLSDNIAHYLHNGNFAAEAVAAAVKDFEGQQACVYVHRYSHRVFAWRNQSPLYRKIEPGRVTLSSSDGDGFELLPAGVIYEIDPDRGLIIDDKASFPASSHYGDHIK